MNPNDILVLDAEFTGNSQEILELAVMDLRGQTRFHSYFRPVKVRSWRLDPHNITPAMVADAPTFAERLAELQQMFDASAAVMGFAVSNDIEHLQEAGIEFDPAKPVIEARELYRLWASLTQEEPMSPFAIPGLNVCAAEFDIHFAEPDAEADPQMPSEHSAAGDTLVTLRLFDALTARLRQLVDTLADASVAQVWEYAHVANEEARIEHYRRSAHGYLLLFATAGGQHALRVLSSPPRSTPPGTVACIEVADRYRAIYDLNDRFGARGTAAMSLTYKLKPKHLEYFRTYTNVYDPDTAEIYRRLVKPMLP